MLKRFKQHVRSRCRGNRVPGLKSNPHGNVTTGAWFGIWSRATGFVLATFAAAAFAQTNFYPTVTVGERIYTNVTIGTITAVDVILFYEGGGARVALSNLPPELQRAFNYDPDRAEQLLAARARQRAALRQRQAAAAADAAVQGRPRTLRVIEVDTSAATPLCATDVGKVWIQGLPQATITRLAELQKVEQQWRTLKAQLLENTRALRIEEAMAPELPGAPEWFVEGIRAQRTREIQLRNTVADQNNALEQLTRLHEELLPVADQLTLIVASKTTRKYLGHEVWKYLGIAPPPEETPDASREEQPPEEPRNDAQN